MKIHIAGVDCSLEVLCTIVVPAKRRLIVFRSSEASAVKYSSLHQSTGSMDYLQENLNVNTNLQLINL